MAILIVCPGMHDPQWTAPLSEQLRTGALWPGAKHYIFPHHPHWAWSPHALRTWLGTTVALGSPLVFLGFSAGCVAAIATAWACQYQRDYPVEAVIALDGWGVPLVGPFATYRLSHDRYTHVTGAWLGPGDQSFYAEPAVPHQQLWQAPQRVWGWGTANPTAAISGLGQGVGVPHRYMTALQFLGQCLSDYGET
ncbi:MAG: hypothetical protein HC812_13305 [Leptolyngbya sp. RL_3_1]|nr:hypothetical protein [Leptolyngbya sp. RL_3_1]